MLRFGSAPGFFGKLPSHGDFVGRGLPPAVRDCFDAWLQEALLESRKKLGPAWLPAWMSAPLWRFLVPADVCGPQAWAGVMMPSHDRLGRIFPLLLAAGMENPPSLDECLTLHDPWFARLETLALSSLEEGFTLAALEAGLGAPEEEGAQPPDRHPASLNAWSDAADPDATRGRGAWWTDGSAQLPPALAVCRGLPAADMFASFLDGCWQERGWRQKLIEAGTGPAAR
jgi:type VI secretion system protein ImpM